MVIGLLQEGSCSQSATTEPLNTTTVILGILGHISHAIVDHLLDRDWALNRRGPLSVVPWRYIHLTRGSLGGRFKYFWAFFFLGSGAWEDESGGVWGGGGAGLIENRGGVKEAILSFGGTHAVQEGVCILLGPKWLHAEKFVLSN